MASTDTFGVFVHADGRRRTAFSAAEAVKYRFDGWRQESDDTATTAQAEADGAAEQPKGDSGRPAAAAKTAPKTAPAPGDGTKAASS